MTPILRICIARLSPAVMDSSSPWAFLHAKVWSPLSFLSRPHSHIRHSSVQSRSLLTAAVLHIVWHPLYGRCSAEVVPTPCPQFARNAAFSVVHSLDQSFCAGMISCVFRVRVMEIAKVSLQRIHTSFSSCSFPSLAYSRFSVKCLSILSA